MAEPMGKTQAPHYHPLVRQVARGLRQRCRVPEGAHLIVAVSGGADSVALLRALTLLAPRRKFGLKLTVAHVNHHLRGERSDADALFVRSLANQLGLPCHITGVSLDGDAGNREAQARKARYAALAQTALQCGASYIATAHHADDQLETLLMRFIRGASVRGLRGIMPRRRLRNDQSSLRLTVVRPMLGAEHDTACAFLESLGQAWREDETNNDTTLVRNRLRHEVVPIIKEIRGDVTKRAEQLTEHFTDLSRLVNEQAPAVADDATIPRDEAQTLNPVVLTQTLRTALIHAGVAPDAIPGHALRPVVQAIRDDEGGERTFSFANQTEVTVTRGEVRIARAKTP